MPLPFKLARTHPRYANADVLVLSVGKSGRTWLRVLVNKYLSLRFGLPFGIEDMGRMNPGIPSIVYAHELWLHRSEATLLERLTQRHVIPDRMLWGKKVVLLARDPRDVLVSLYFQVTRRSSRTRHTVTMPVGEFAAHPRFGIRAIVRVLNEWHERFHGHPAFMLMRYEDLMADAAPELGRLLRFCGIGDEGGPALAQAVEFARFENMRKMEAEGSFDRAALRPADPSDPDSFKVREGKVGGYRSRFTEAELAQIEREMRGLNPLFGYETVGY